MINPIGLVGSISGLGGAGAATGTAIGRNVAGANEASFASVLSNAAAKTIGQLEQAEAVSIQALQGNADTREVVDAVMRAQESLAAAIAIRDKIVSAYLDISRMTI